jgi:hypothetical protein
VKNPKEGINYLKTSSKSYAYLGFREILIYLMLINGPKFFYLAPKTDESSLIVQHFGIAMHKQFKYKNQFNKLYSNLDFAKLKIYSLIYFQHFYFKKRWFCRSLENYRI